MLKQIGFLFIAFGGLVASTSTQPPAVETVRSDDNAMCESNKSQLDRLLNAESKGVIQIFVISHRSTHENAAVDWQRLNLVYSFVVRSKGFPSDKLTLGAGQPSSKNKLGKLEFWVGDEKQLIIELGRNQLPCLFGSEKVRK